MPAVILPDEGIEDQHARSLGVDLPMFLPWRLMLFVNNITPDHATVLADLTEATFNGYHQITIDPSLWQFTPATDGCSHAQWTSTPYAWNVTGGPLDTIYGWAMIDPVGGVIRRCQRFDDADIAAVVIGQPFTLPILATFTSGECP